MAKLRKLYNYLNMIYRRLRIYLVGTQIETFILETKLYSRKFTREPFHFVDCVVWWHKKAQFGDSQSSSVWKIHLCQINVRQRLCILYNIAIILCVLYNIFIVPILPVSRALHQIRTKSATLHSSLCLLQRCKKYIESSQRCTCILFGTMLKAQENGEY